MWSLPACCVLYIISVHSLHVQAVSLADRQKCGPNDVAPTTRVDTTERLSRFRAALSRIQVDNKSVVAFIVGSGDAHNSEYPTSHDQRRAYITGFAGSAGTALITQNKAALWTDGRYFVEAEDTLDCNWILMKSGLANVPNFGDWLNDVIGENGAFVGVDRTLYSHTSFNSLSNQLQKQSKGLVLQAVSRNPVDEAWASDRQPQPEQPRTGINALNLTFSGKSWQDKVADVQTTLRNKNISAFVVTALDETAWLFNLRGSDIKYNPFFLSYAIVEQARVRLYVLDKDRRLQAQPTDPETKVSLSEHLGTSRTGSCVDQRAACVEVPEYNQAEVEAALMDISNTSKVWITYEANYAIYLATAKNRIIDKSPIALVKSKKNEVEQTGMQSSHNRDSAALITFLAFMENEITSGRQWTEVSAAAELDGRRKQLQYNRGLSFTTISGYGSNGAIIHYSPSNATDKKITTDSLYLLDSGGQYLDGTTDVTRTMHYGNPTSYEKECYTRVLMSAINLAMLKWPRGLYGHQIDAIARSPLWEVGFVYRHGTGHGIGAYLSVHEGPGSIGLTLSSNPSSEPLDAYQFYSDEPGYYENGKFGIRLETIVMIKPATPKYTTANETFYEFQPITLVPFETKLIDYSLLSLKQAEWLNDYNDRARSHILPLLEGDQTAVNWFTERTQTINTAFYKYSTASQTCNHPVLYIAVLATFLQLIS
ncbi:hypothetical protein BsWGS_13075 [Bradybaena similaris]